LIPVTGTVTFSAPAGKLMVDATLATEGSLELRLMRALVARGAERLSVRF
jgi:hypothetical protein